LLASGWPGASPGADEGDAEQLLLPVIEHRLALEIEAADADQRLSLQR
jgi:hypothetical protein